MRGFWHCNKSIIISQKVVCFCAVLRSARALLSTNVVIVVFATSGSRSKGQRVGRSTAAVEQRAEKRKCDPVVLLKLQADQDDHYQWTIFSLLPRRRLRLRNQTLPVDGPVSSSCVQRHVNNVIKFPRLTSVPQLTIICKKAQGILQRRAKLHRSTVQTSRVHQWSGLVFRLM